MDSFQERLSKKPVEVEKAEAISAAILIGILSSSGRMSGRYQRVSRRVSLKAARARRGWSDLTVEVALDPNGMDAGEVLSHAERQHPKGTESYSRDRPQGFEDG